MRILLFLFLFSFSMLVSMEHHQFDKPRRSSRALPAANPATPNEQSPMGLLNKYSQDFTAKLNAVGVIVVEFGTNSHKTLYRPK
jgi:hypothetical protein